MKKSTLAFALAASITLPSLALGSLPEGSAGPTGDSSILPIGVLTLDSSNWVVSSDNFTTYRGLDGETTECPPKDIVPCINALNEDLETEAGKPEGEKPEDGKPEEKPEENPEKPEGTKPGGEEGGETGEGGKGPKKGKKEKDKSSTQLDPSTCDVYTKDKFGEVCAIEDDDMESTRQWESSGIFWVCPNDGGCYFADYFTSKNALGFIDKVRPALFYRYFK